MTSDIIGALCLGLLSAKGRSSLKGFIKIYVIVYIDKITVDLVLTNPSRKMRWDIEKLSNKIGLVTILYEKKQKYITYIYSIAALRYTGLNKTHLFMIESIFRWVK